MFRFAKPLAVLCSLVLAPLALAANLAPIAPTFPTPPVAEVAVRFSYQVPAFTDPEGKTLTYSVSNRPKWLSFTKSTRVLSGTPGRAVIPAGTSKTYTVTVTAKDPGGKTTSRKLAIRLVSVRPIGNRAPVVANPIAPQAATEDQPWAFTVPHTTFSDPDGTTPVITAPNLPIWLLFNAATRTFSGTPGHDQRGAQQIPLRAQDSLGATTDTTFTVNVAPTNHPPVALHAIAQVDAYEGQQFLDAYGPGAVARFAFDDPDDDALTLSITGAPDWLTLFDADGPYGEDWRGTPQSGDVGNHTITVTATDPSGASVSLPLEIVVRAVNQAPVLSGVAQPPLAVPLDAEFEWTVPLELFEDPDGDELAVRVRGGLPGWLSYDEGSRTFSGYPRATDEGDHAVGIYAADPSGATVDLALTFEVDDGNRAPTRTVQGDVDATVGEVTQVAVPVWTDPDGDGVTMAASGLPSWATLVPGTGATAFTLVFEPTEADLRGVGITITATDAGGQESRDTFLVRAVDAAAGTSSLEVSVMAPLDLRPEGDDNDPRSDYRPNDDLDTAQRIDRLPTRMVGWASAVATGDASQRFGAVADPVDAFLVRFDAGSTARLQEADAADSDHDLFLLDPATLDVIDFSIGSGGLETVTAPDDGEYLVLVEAASGAGTYLLNFDEPGEAGPASASITARHEFVAGEAVVTLSPRGKQQGAATVASKQGARVLAGDASRPFKLGLDLGRAAAAVAGKPDGRLLGRIRDDRRHGASIATARAIKALRADPLVRTADANFIRRPLVTPSDPEFIKQWHLTQMGVPQAWEVSKGSASVVIAVVDTGVFLSHPDLAANLRSDGYDFISDPLISRDGDGIDPDPSDAGDELAPGASSFHGTHVAGIAAARGNNAIGVSGVGWNTQVLPIRVLGLGGGTSFDIIEGVRYAARLSNGSGTLPAVAADVINLSLGGGGFSSTEQAVYAEVRALGIFVVAAAGNDGTSDPHYPSAYTGVVSVSATNVLRELADYSTFGPTVDLAAPGGTLNTNLDGDAFSDGVYSTAATDASGTITPYYVGLHGTSMATPNVAGAIGLMLAVHPTYTPAEFDADLAAGLLTFDLGGDGATVRNDQFGFGMINASKAVLRARERAGPGAGPLLSVDPPSISLPAGNNSAMVTVSDAGGGSPTIMGTTRDKDWITVTPYAVDARGFGQYEVTVDFGAAGALVGAQQATVVFYTDLGVNATLSVSAQPSPFESPSTADAGRMYLVVTDPDTLTPIAEAADDAANDGFFQFTIALPPGQYLVYAGTDHDGDGYTCDPGEACGAYATLIAPTEVTMPHPGPGLSFSTLVTAPLSGPAQATAMALKSPNGILRPAPAPSAPVPSDAADAAPATPREMPPKEPLPTTRSR